MNYFFYFLVGLASLEAAFEGEELMFFVEQCVQNPLNDLCKDFVPKFQELRDLIEKKQLDELEPFKKT